MTRITLPPFGPYKVPLSSPSAVDAVVVVDDAGAATNASFADAATQQPCIVFVISNKGLFDAADVDVVVAAVAAAVVDVDNDLILFNLGQLNFKPQFGLFTLLSLFIGSLANWHLLQHFVGCATLDDDWRDFLCWHCTQFTVPTEDEK